MSGSENRSLRHPNIMYNYRVTFVKRMNNKDKFYKNQKNKKVVF